MKVEVSISQGHENDLISRRKAIEKLDFYMQSTMSDFECEIRDDDVDFYKACHLAKKIITNMPSAQPEIIRCRDCKHYNAGFECLIEGYGVERDKNWYCGDAERRADDSISD